MSGCGPPRRGVATAAQALAGKTFRASDLAETLEGKLVDAVLSVAAGYTMESLQDERAKYTAAVSAVLGEDLAQNGLLLESVSLTRLDQTPFHALDENNAFNALGMRRLAEIIAVNRKERAEIESDAEVSVRQSQLNTTKQRLLLSQEEEEATIAQQREIETARAASQADVAEEQSASERRREAARIERERQVRMAEIARDRELRRQQIDAELSTETVKADNAVKLAAKRIERAGAEAEVHAARAHEAEAEEQAQTARETAAAERGKALALIRAEEQAEVDDTRVRSEAGTLISMATAEAKAVLERAAAERDELLARAEGTSALIQAENAQSADLIRLKLDRARIEALPGIVERMMKPAEKIETIRINQITSGFGAGGSGAGGGGAAGGGGEPRGDASAVNQVIDGVLNLALQLPAVRKLGEEVGINVGGGVRGLSAPLDADAADEAAVRGEAGSDDGGSRGSRAGEGGGEDASGSRE